MKTETGYALAYLSIFYLIGFVALGYGVWSAWRSTLAGSWPKTSCQLTELELKELPSSGGDGPTYGLRIRYSYTVDGASYEGSRLAYGYGSSSNRQPHEAIYRKLKAAKAVTVRYDPANPAASCLSFGIHPSIRFLLIFAIFWLGLCVGFTCLCCLTHETDNVLLRNLSVE